MSERADLEDFQNWGNMVMTVVQCIPATHRFNNIEILFNELSIK